MEKDTVTQEDDEDDIDPVKMLFPLDETLGNDAPPTLTGDISSEQLLQHHYVPSIESTLVIRQLPSQGLSFKLWPAATTLVTLLDLFRCHPTESPLASILSNGTSHYRRLNIIELGSGTGLVGMAAAAILGAKVVVTDLPHVIANLQFNVDANAGLLSLEGGSVHVAPLRWGEADDVEVVGREFDIVLGSDVVYHDHLFDPLLETLRLFLNSGGETGRKEKKTTTFVMAHLKRWKKDSVFFKKAKKLFDVETVHVDGPCDGARIGVAVYRMAEKAKSIQRSNVS